MEIAFGVSYTMHFLEIKEGWWVEGLHDWWGNDTIEISLENEEGR